MRSVSFLFALSLSPLIYANSGSWSQTTTGGHINIGGQIHVSPPLSPQQGILYTNHVTRISWKISLLSPPPSGLKIKLCTETKCIQLDRLSGQRETDSALSVQGPFRFVYSVERRGQLIPPLNVVSNQLTINYR